MTSIACGSGLLSCAALGLVLVLVGEEPARGNVRITNCVHLEEPRAQGLDGFIESREELMHQLRHGHVPHFAAQLCEVHHIKLHHDSKTHSARAKAPQPPQSHVVARVRACARLVACIHEQPQSLLHKVVGEQVLEGGTNACLLERDHVGEMKEGAPAAVDAARHCVDCENGGEHTGQVAIEKQKPQRHL
jgi:hypothetical protein